MLVTELAEKALARHRSASTSGSSAHHAVAEESSERIYGASNRSNRSFEETESKLLLFPPTPDDLKYPLDFVRREVPDLSSSYRERYEYWLDLMTGAGWSQEDAERAAFRRVITGPPNSQKEEVTDVRTENRQRD